MEELLDGYRIDGSRRTVAADFLDELVEVYREDIAQARKHQRGDVRKELTDAANWLVAAGKRAGFQYVTLDLQDSRPRDFATLSSGSIECDV